MKILLLAFALAQSPSEAPADNAVGTPEVAVELADDLADEGIGEAPLGDPPARAEIDDRTGALAVALRCPVCQGLSVEASPSEAARAMRDRIEGLVASGYSDQQIVDYFVDRYGTWVLLEPPKQGLKWVLWIGPAAVVGAGALALLLRSRRRLPAADQPGVPSPAPRSDDPYRARVLAEIDGTEVR